MWSLANNTNYAVLCLPHSLQHCSFQIPRNSSQHHRLKCQIHFFFASTTYIGDILLGKCSHSLQPCVSVSVEMKHSAWSRSYYKCMKLHISLLWDCATDCSIHTPTGHLQENVALTYKWKALRTNCQDETHKKIFRGQLCSSSNVYVMIKVVRNEV